MLFSWATIFQVILISLDSWPLANTSSFLSIFAATDDSQITHYISQGNFISLYNRVKGATAGFRKIQDAFLEAGQRADPDVEHWGIS